ncbi:Syntaxin-17 [Strongyloides ratti]|uniref:Syntaxin-17 n=1 Tax=Strongyloides ratti TaxID=34506 RepID=A0A090L3W9_STRRB|nr:Syntaxin-17 [Strongyloides ratti]CEF64417.1 Syntaxin-17 [Strongyloides ratti]
MLDMIEVIENFEKETSEVFNKLGILKEEITIGDRRGTNIGDKKKEYDNCLEYIISEYNVLLFHRNNLNYKEKLEFDRKIQNIKNKINYFKLTTGSSFVEQENIPSYNPFVEGGDSIENEGSQMYKEAKLRELMLIAQEKKAIAEAQRQLESDVRDLNDIMEDLHKIVHSQNDMVDSIEHNIEQSVAQVEKGNEEIRKAVKAKNKKVPLIAAAVGGIACGGPAGIAVGTGTGIVAAITGAVTGLIGGRWLTNKVTKND